VFIIALVRIGSFLLECVHHLTVAHKKWWRMDILRYSVIHIPKFS
jgi:hypothetical protein